MNIGSIKIKIAKQISISFAKIALGSLGTFLVTAGYFNEGQVAEFSGYILGLIALAWSAYDNSQKVKLPKEVVKDQEVVVAINKSPVPVNINMPTDVELPPY